MTPLLRGMERVSETFVTAIRGVSVEKTVWANGEGLSVVRFEITSERDDPVRLRVVEAVPDDFSMENLGPHPKYGGDKWTKTDRREFVFTDRLAPEGETTTLYGIKGLSSSTLESFLTKAVVEIDPARDEPTDDGDDSTTMTNDQPANSDDDETAQEPTFDPTNNFENRIPRVEDLRSSSGAWNGGNGTRDENASDIQFVGSKVQSSTDHDAESDSESGSPIELADPTEHLDESDSDEVDAEQSESPDDSSVATGETEEPEETEDPEETAETDEPTEESDTSNTERFDSDDEAEVETRSMTDENDAESADAPATENVVDALVAELSSRDLSADEKAVLRESLGVSERNSLDVRLSHVQTRVDNLAAYTTALEEFLDDNGTAEQVIDDLQTDTEEMRDDIERLDSALAASKEAIQAIEEQVTAIEDRMVTESTFDERLTELDERLASESKLEASVDELTDELAEIRTDVETGKTWRSNLSQAIQIPGMSDDHSETDDESDDAEEHSDTDDGETADSVDADAGEGDADEGTADDAEDVEDTEPVEL